MARSFLPDLESYTWIFYNSDILMMRGFRPDLKTCAWLIIYKWVSQTKVIPLHGTKLSAFIQILN